MADGFIKVSEFVRLDLNDFHRLAHDFIELVDGFLYLQKPLTDFQKKIAFLIRSIKNNDYRICGTSFRQKAEAVLIYILYQAETEDFLFSPEEIELIVALWFWKTEDETLVDEYSNFEALGNDLSLSDEELDRQKMVKNELARRGYNPPSFGQKGGK
jgi:hypothetical protein